jgi:Glycosyl transferases group 1
LLQSHRAVPAQRCVRGAARAGETMHIAQVAPLYEAVPPRAYGTTERVIYHLTEELVRRGRNRVRATGRPPGQCERVAAAQWPEPFGIVMIQAMACGTPTIAFRCGAVPEIIEDGRIGFHRRRHRQRRPGSLARGRAEPAGAAARHSRRTSRLRVWLTIMFRCTNDCWCRAPSCTVK